MKKAALFILLGFILAPIFGGCTAKKESAKSSGNRSEGCSQG